MPLIGRTKSSLLIMQIITSDIPRATVAAALRELRAGYTYRADGEGASIEWRAATDLARQELDATIAALGLADEVQEETR